MPTIAVDKEDLYKSLGREYTTEEFDELCFEFGIELDEDTSQSDLPAGERPQLKIEIPANRYDMLCFEGISKALNVFLSREKAPNFKLVEAPKEKQITIVVDPSTEKVRPYVAGAVLRGVHFNQRSYDSFISLQEKLHANICRNRSLVAIGTHDLSKIKGSKISYTGVVPEKVKFAPLNQTKVMTGPELMEFYEKDRNIGKYLHLIRDSDVYPIFYDEEENVLSMPPIINSNKTKISLETNDIFIDLSGTDKTKIEVVVNQIVAMFSRYSSTPFTIEPVKIISEHNNLSRTCPNISPRKTTAEVDYINSVLGLKLSPQEICDLLSKMMLEATPSANSSNLLDVTIPITRSDILHQCDIMEDAGIAYGFNNLNRTFPADSFTIGEPLPINKVSDIVRREVAMAGWTEVMALTLCSHDENFAFLNRKDNGTEAVHLENPKTAEYQVVRTSLLPGLLKTIKENRKHSLPLKIFEVSDVVFKDTSLERQAYNNRRFGAVYAGKTSGFEIVHGLLDRVMKMLRVPWSDEKSDERGYWISELNNPTYFPGRGASIWYQEAKGSSPRQIGTLGVLHPQVLSNFEIPYVASSIELDVETFLIK
ncbi:phenylalanine--tRNA ligase subunit beta [Sugiyamaella lignohabitans]|uniref:Phenylalanine--tRNA ligase beta subunit n=1 Tax=Sugiyamaella lignohabitans TaxID=796027 RepID=A0A167EGI9_9ASCO|nr:phenylalanine--tRNA ligase subunit beta [Sugiyamaella lignohabitans]ANB14056.1 phenylalanine--tRNA ligase subunit beta [Sugiyamaella lignohabitans]